MLLKINCAHCESENVRLSSKYFADFYCKDCDDHFDLGDYSNKQLLENIHDLTCSECKELNLG